MHVLRQVDMPSKEHGVEGTAAVAVAAAVVAAFVEVVATVALLCFDPALAEVASTPLKSPERRFTTVVMPVVRVPTGVALRPGTWRGEGEKGSKAQREN